MTAAKKILWVFSSFDQGPGVKRFAALARETRGRMDHVVASLDGVWSGAALIPAAQGWRKLDLPARGKGLVSISSLWAVRRVLSEEKPDLVVTANGGALEWLMVNRGPGAAPHVHMEDLVGADGVVDATDRNRNWARRRAFPGRDRVFVTGSESIEAAFTAHWGVAPAFVRRIGHGAPAALFELPASVVAEGEPVVFGAIGPLTAGRRLERLLRLVATLRKRGRNARALIVGSGPGGADLRAEAERLGLGDGFEMRPFDGRPESVGAALADLDVYVDTGAAEQDAPMLVDAMAAGRAALAVASDRTAATLAEANRMFMRAGDDAGALSAAAELLCIDPDIRRMLGSANRTRAAAMFSGTRMTARFEGVLNAFFEAPAPLMLPAPESFEATPNRPAPAASAGRELAVREPAVREPVAARAAAAPAAVSAQIALPAPVDAFAVEFEPVETAPTPDGGPVETAAPTRSTAETPYRRRSAAELTREVLMRTRGDLFGMRAPAKPRAEAG